MLFLSGRAKAFLSESWSVSAPAWLAPAMMVTGVVSSIVQSAAALASSVAINAPRFIISPEGGS